MSFEEFVKEILEKYPNVIIEEIGNFNKKRIIFWNGKRLVDNVWIGEDSDMYYELEADIIFDERDQDYESYPSDAEILERMIQKGGRMKEFEKLLDEAKDMLNKMKEVERKMREDEITKIRKIIIDERIPTYFVLEEIENQWGEKIQSDYIYIDTENMKCYRVQLNCYNSASEGLGTCQCVSHPTWITEEITPEAYLELIKGTLRKK